MIWNFEIQSNLAKSGSVIYKQWNKNTPNPDLSSANGLPCPQLKYIKSWKYLQIQRDLVKLRHMNMKIVLIKEHLELLSEHKIQNNTN